MKNSKIVYLVDDDQDDLMLLRDALENTIPDVDITEVNDGKQLLDLISEEEADLGPALILMDMNMPRVSGLQALLVLKNNPKTQHIPVVMISTSADPNLISKAYEDGISAYMTKPVSIQEYDLIAQAINICFLNNYPEIESMTVTQNFKNKSMLVIEDSDEQWSLMKYIFKKSMPDIEVIRTFDADGTLEYFNSQWGMTKNNPELIILDLYLPTRQEGLGLLDAIRKFFEHRNLPAVPVIVFSSSDNKDDIKDSYRHNANAYIVKSADLNKSFAYFKNLCHFWWNTISLPKKK